MSSFLAMGFTTTPDSSGYFLRLPQLWPIFVLPLVCFYTLLAVWIFKKLRGDDAAQQSGSVPPSAPPSQPSAPPDANVSPSTPAAEGCWPLEFRAAAEFGGTSW
jgi:hypothetical protein